MIAVEPEAASAALLREGVTPRPPRPLSLSRSLSFSLVLSRSLSLSLALSRSLSLSLSLPLGLVA